MSKESANSLLKKSFIEPLYTFRVKDYINSESKIISQIQKRFSKRIIVRSSTSKEDGLSQSYAGEFLTVQNIDISSNKLISLIELTGQWSNSSKIKQKLEKYIYSLNSEKVAKFLRFATGSTKYT